MAKASKDRSEFSVGWICALEHELTASRAMLDEEFALFRSQDTLDHNIYVPGRIGLHNIVMVCLPAGQYGIGSAAVVAKDMQRSFKSIRFNLMVGIGGGVPASDIDLRLGDVVVSQPVKDYGAVIPYDLRKSMPGDTFERKGFLNKPPLVLLNAIQYLKSKYELDKLNLPQHLQNTIKMSFSNLSLYQRPDPDQCPDRLFETECDHAPQLTCGDCGSHKLAVRPVRFDRNGEPDTAPHIHYGLIASGNSVIASARERDRLRETAPIICIEMEAAGLMDDLGCLVIRGICDYADADKQDGWQRYAAATAAAYTKELLAVVPIAKVEPSTAKPDEKEYDESTLQSLRALKVTDPRDDKIEILAHKDPLLEGTCDWICFDPAFCDWYSSPHIHMLWLNGDPGKGKTMIMAALTDLLESRVKSSESDFLAYYFCQSANRATNRATSILRGIIYMLTIKNKGLASYVEQRYHTSGKDIFKGGKALYTLWEILQDIAADVRVRCLYISVDALDECRHELPDLLRLITRSRPNSPCKTKWLLSSRNEAHIVKMLEPALDSTRISLEVNAARVAKAVDRYIDTRMEELHHLSAGDGNMAFAVRQYLHDNAEGTFLWVWLVCQELSKSEAWDDIQDIATRFPRGLEEIYDNMAIRIEHSSAADYFKALLQAAEIAREPLSLEEACLVAQLPEQRFYNSRVIESLIRQCGSFLAVRDGKVAFVHKSASDYFQSSRAATIFKLTTEEAHKSVTLACFGAMAASLHQDMCAVKLPGTLIDDIDSDVIESSIQPKLRYASTHWNYHFQEAFVRENAAWTSTLTRQLSVFMENTFLFWIECMCLLCRVSECLIILQELLEHFKDAYTKEEALIFILAEARSWLASIIGGIELAPLQIYTAGISFCQDDHFVRSCYSHLSNRNITVLRPHRSRQSHQSHMLEGHRSSVISTTFSRDHKWIVSVDIRGVVCVWNNPTGMLIHQMKGSKADVYWVAFSEDDTNFQVASANLRMRTWNLSTGYLEDVSSICSEGNHGPLSFSQSGKWMASVERSTILVRNVSDGNLMQKLVLPARSVDWLSFSADERFLAALSETGKAGIWEVSNGMLVNHFNDIKSIRGPFIGIDILAISDRLMVVQYLTSPARVEVFGIATRTLIRALPTEDGSYIELIRFTFDGNLLAFGFDSGLIQLWDTHDWSLLREFVHCDRVTSMTISRDNSRIASGTSNGMVGVWNIPEAPSEVNGPSDFAHIRSLDCCVNGRLAVTGLGNNVLNVWDSTQGIILRSITLTDIEYLNKILVSPNGSLVAVVGRSNATIWSLSAGEKLFTIQHDSTFRRNVLKFSNTDGMLAYATQSQTVQIRDSMKGGLLFTIKNRHKCLNDPQLDRIYLISFSHDDSLIMIGMACGEIFVWDIRKSMNLKCHVQGSEWPFFAILSKDDQQLAFASISGKGDIWSLHTGVCEKSLSKLHVRSEEDLRFAVGWHRGNDDSSSQPFLSLGKSNKWIMYNGERFLWLPPSVRPKKAAIANGCVALATNAGKMTFVHIS